MSKEAWDLKAKNFPRFVQDSADTLEILEFLRQSGADWRAKRLIDVGCGNGRFSLQLAKEVKEILGVDISDVMLKALLDDARTLGIDNITTLQSSWEDFYTQELFDIAFCAMTPALNNKQGFLKALAVCTEGLCYVGWGRVRECAFVDTILREHNVALTLPVGLPNVLEWLEELKIPTLPFVYKQSDFTYQGSESKAIDDIAFQVSIHGGVPNMQRIQEYIRDSLQNGVITYTHKREIGIAYIKK